MLVNIFTTCDFRYNEGRKKNYSININRLKKNINMSNIQIDTIQQVYWNIYKIGNADDDVPGPSDYYIIASFKLLKKIDTNKLKKINILRKPLKKNSIYYKKWLPRKIKYLFDKKRKNLNIPIYSTRIFNKSPYLNGFFCISDSLYVYLYMYTQ